MPGVAIGAVCIASASGGKVGSPGAGGVTVGKALTSQLTGGKDGAVLVGLPGSGEATIAGVGDRAGAGEGELNRLDRSRITARTMNITKKTGNAFRVFFMPTPSVEEAG